MGVPAASEQLPGERALRFAAALDEQRAGYWIAADTARDMLSGALTVKERKARLHALAGLAHCKIEYVKVLAALADAFPPEYRYPDVDRTMYRACLQASIRTKVPATKILDDALRNDWLPRRVYALGRKSYKTFVARGECLACGGWLNFRRKGPANLLIPCPGCIADAHAEGRTLLDAFVAIAPLE